MPGESPGGIHHLVKTIHYCCMEKAPFKKLITDQLKSKRLFGFYPLAHLVPKGKIRTTSKKYWPEKFRLRSVRKDHMETGEATNYLRSALGGMPNSLEKVLEK